MSHYPDGKAPICPVCQRNRIRNRGSKTCLQCRQDPGWYSRADTPATNPVVPQPPEPDPPDRAHAYEAQWADWLKYIECRRERYRGPRIRAVGAMSKIVVASDFHLPFQSQETIERLFEEEADADLAILAGDLTDSFAISRFIKYETVPFREELAALTILFERASQTWPRVIVIEGNHDKARFEKQLRTRLDDHMVDIVSFLANGNLSVLRALASRYPNVTVASMPAGRYTMDWITQIGDLVVTHAEKFSIIPGQALRKIEDWLLDQENNLNLAPWRVVLQAHTHGLAWLPYHADRLLVETGCCCDLQGYQFTAKIGGRPQRNGWVTLTQVSGVTDRESVRCHWPDEKREAA